jgi:phage terminase large subunit
VVDILKLPGMKTEEVSVGTDIFKVKGPKHLVKIYEHDECEPTEYWISHEHRPYQWDWEVKITKKAAMELKQYLEFIPGLKC